MITLQPRSWPFGEPSADPTPSGAPHGDAPRRSRLWGLLGLVLVLAVAASTVAWVAGGTDFSFLPFVASDKPTVVLGATVNRDHARWDLVAPPDRDAVIALCRDDPFLGRGVVTVRVRNGTPSTARYRIKVDVVSSTDGSTVASGSTTVKRLLPLESVEGITTVRSRIPDGSTCHLTSVTRVQVG